MEREHEPGTAKFGNFINYYSFNPASRRVDRLPSDLLKYIAPNCDSPEKSIHILDLGCNAGELTIAIYKKLKNENPEAQIKVLGIDIDEKLIERARNINDAPDDITFEVVNIASNQERVAAISSWLSLHGATQFNLITAFSVTMWIHLHNGDNGLQDVLMYLSEQSFNIIVEPQPWKCYKNAVRRMKRGECDGFEHYDSLEWRSDVDELICAFLQNACKMKLIETFGTTEWDRRICLFSKQ